LGIGLGNRVRDLLISKVSKIGARHDELREGPPDRYAVRDGSSTA
jgi:hypothetical protein